MNRLWLVSYDIADDRRRHRVERLLLGLGERTQESLFETVLSAQRARAQARQMLGLLDQHTDSVALLPVCRDCLRRSRHLGLGRGRMLGPTHFIAV